MRKSGKHGIYILLYIYILYIYILYVYVYIVCWFSMVFPVFSGDHPIIPIRAFGVDHAGALHNDLRQGLPWSSIALEKNFGHDHSLLQGEPSCNLGFDGMAE
jgi:hypothetical protein